MSQMSGSSPSRLNTYVATEYIAVWIDSGARQNGCHARSMRFKCAPMEKTFAGPFLVLIDSQASVWLPGTNAIQLPTTAFPFPKTIKPG